MRWWAVFFMAGFFVPCNPFVLFITAVILAAVYFHRVRGRGGSGYVSIGLYAFSSGMPGETVRFLVISSTALIIMSASFLSFNSDRIPGLDVSLSIKFSGREKSSAMAGKDQEGWFDGIKESLESYTLRARKYVKNSIEDPFLSDTAKNLLLAFMLADRSSLDRRLAEKYGFLGIAHFLALSGLHLGIIAVTLSSVLALLCFPRIVREAILLCILFLYTAIAGFPHSLLRALSLFVAIRYFRWAGIRGSLSDALITGSFFLLAARPSLLFSRGYQLSFLAVAGISYIGIPVQERMASFFHERKSWKIVKYAVSAAAMTISIQVFTLPVVLALFGRIPLISPVANILVMIPVMLMLYLGMLFLALPFEFARYLVVPVINFAGSIMEGLPDLLAGLPNPAIYRGDIECVSYWAGILMLSMMLNRRARMRRRLFVLCVICIVISFGAGASSRTNSLTGVDRSTTLPAGYNTGVRRVFGNKRVLILENTLSFSRARHLTRDLWLSGVREIDCVIIVSGNVRFIEGLPLLVDRMRVTRIVCSPYLEHDITRVMTEIRSASVLIEAIDSLLVIENGEADIELTPPAFPLKKGKKISAIDAAISWRLIYR